MQYQLANIGVLRVDDNAWIPNDLRNSDWLSYQSWLAAGNVPLPLPAPQPIPQPPTLLEQVMALSAADKKTMFTSLSAATAAASIP